MNWLGYSVQCRVSPFSESRLRMRSPVSRPLNRALKAIWVAACGLLSELCGIIRRGSGPHMYHNWQTSHWLKIARGQAWIVPQLLGSYYDASEILLLSYTRIGIPCQSINWMFRSCIN